MLLWFEYCEPGVVWGEALGLRGKGKEILKERAIAVEWSTVRA